MAVLRGNSVGDSRIIGSRSYQSLPYCISLTNHYLLHFSYQSLPYCISFTSHYPTAFLLPIITLLHFSYQSLPYCTSLTNHYPTAFLLPIITLLHLSYQSLPYCISLTNHYPTAFLVTLQPSQFARLFPMESKSSKWWNSNFVNKWTLLILFILFILFTDCWNLQMCWMHGCAFEKCMHY